MKILTYRIIFGALGVLSCANGTLHAQKAPEVPGNLKNERIASEQKQIGQEQIVSRSLKSDGKTDQVNRGKQVDSLKQGADVSPGLKNNGTPRTFNWQN